MVPALKTGVIEFSGTEILPDLSLDCSGAPGLAPSHSPALLPLDTDLVDARAALLIAGKFTETAAWTELNRNTPSRDGIIFPSFPNTPSSYVDERAASVAILGPVLETSLTDPEADYLSLALGKSFDLHAGSPIGNPGKVLDSAFRLSPDGARIIHEIADVRNFREDRYTPNYYPCQEDAIDGLIADTSGALVLGGGEITLAETIMALQMQKPVVIVRGFGPLPRFIENDDNFARYQSLFFVNTVCHAATKLHELKKSGALDRVPGHPVLHP